MFQLKNRLTKTYNPAVDSFFSLDGGEGSHNVDVEHHEADDAVVDQGGNIVDEYVGSGEQLDNCSHNKPQGGHCRVYAQFGRRQTHNEELCVASCGIILGRATFFGAEGRRAK